MITKGNCIVEENGIGTPTPTPKPTTMPSISSKK
jgi:hypothetical protein